MTSFTPLRLYVETMPIQKAAASGKGNIEFYIGNGTFKFKITPDRHNAGPKLIYCLLPEPAHFSLPFTFKANDINLLPSVSALASFVDYDKIISQMRSSLVVRASVCQCTNCNGPGFDPSIRRHSGI
jgi:hypothetical protein